MAAKNTSPHREGEIGTQVAWMQGQLGPAWVLGACFLSLEFPRCPGGGQEPRESVDSWVVTAGNTTTRRSEASQSPDLEGERCGRGPASKAGSREMPPRCPPTSDSYRSSTAKPTQSSEPIGRLQVAHPQWVTAGGQGWGRMGQVGKTHSRGWGTIPAMGKPLHLARPWSPLCSRDKSWRPPTGCGNDPQ